MEGLLSFICVPEEPVYMTYYLDNNQTNPYLKWKELGSPDFPSPEQFQQIRDAEVWLCICLKCCMAKVVVNWLITDKETRHQLR